MEFRTRIFENIRTAPPNQNVFEALKHKALPAVTYHQLKQFLSGIDQSQISSTSVIGIYANRTPEAYLSVLAAFLLGKKFVPLNPKFPELKLKRIVELSNVDLILASSPLSKVPDLSAPVLSVTNLFLEILGSEITPDFYETEVDGDDSVYHLFTSGSTGDPKGVPISYSNLHHYVSGISDLISFGDGKRFSQVFDLSFDLSMHDIFVCLYHQGTLIPASDFDILLPVKYIERNRIDHWFSVPVLAEVTVRNFDKQPTEHELETALFCGEALPVSTAMNFQKCLKPNVAWNLYGPTEATIAFTARRIEPLPVDVNVFTVGNPFGINKTAIELHSGEIVTTFKDGVEGEFLLGGAQVFEGYRPNVGNGVFAGDVQQLYYRSGDLVRVENGEICFIGRKDSQVKIRGHRVELGEIESAFRHITGVDLVVAFITGDTFNPDIRLAYQSDIALDAEHELKKRLPAYMLPSSVTHFSTLPLNANGKIDRKALARLAHD